MLKKVKDSTIDVLKDALQDLNIVGKISEDDINKICEYFEEKEVEYSTKQTNGEKIDIEKFNKICLAVDDFFIEADSNSSIDLEDLNTRLGL